ncbi:MAG TPA: transcription termination factor Rho [Acidobacteriota bacterium]|nr:transcription termination factor Rho [Acidobacteriota bacterium]
MNNTDKSADQGRSSRGGKKPYRRKPKKQKKARSKSNSKPRRGGRPPKSGGGQRGKRGGRPRSAPGPADTAVRGILEVLPDGFGFVRDPEQNFQAAEDDIFVPPHVVRHNNLQSGCMVEGKAGKRKGKLQLQEVEKVEGTDPESFAKRPAFNRLTSVNPFERLEIDQSNDTSMRILDLVAPIGKGQRGLIVAPPRTGKTILLQKLANAIHHSHPEVHLLMMLIDERPEEVTEMKRATPAEVIHSSNDHSPKRHVKIVEMVLERSRRMVEAGKDVVILLDSLTRVARAFNTENRGSGRTLSGGLDANTMIKPREFFGAARKLEEGGSITIIATALIDTGSRMDDVIFEEFKGTGNMELYLHRGLADRRIWPAIDIHLSGTRREEKLRAPEAQRKVDMLRRALAETSAEEALQLLRGKIEQTPSNERFLELVR